jgi:hypothetical protein
VRVNDSTSLPTFTGRSGPRGLLRGPSGLLRAPRGPAAAACTCPVRPTSGVVAAPFVVVVRAVNIYRNAEPLNIYI